MLVCATELYRPASLLGMHAWIWRLRLLLRNLRPQAPFQTCNGSIEGGKNAFKEYKETPVQRLLLLRQLHRS